MATTSVQFTGMLEFKELLQELNQDFSIQDKKNILSRAVRASMGSVLATAKSLAPKDTGGLAASLRIEARKPNNKDKKSVYVSPADVVIGTVTTASGKQLARKKFENLKTGQKQTGIKSDARAIAMEFGTAKLAAKPYMRPAMESTKGAVLNSLSNDLATALSKYKSKKTK
jgi:HK97 gp10 family phage protein